MVTKETYVHKGPNFNLVIIRGGGGVEILVKFDHAILKMITAIREGSSPQAKFVFHLWCKNINFVKHFHLWCKFKIFA